MDEDEQQKRDARVAQLLVRKQRVMAANSNPLRNFNNKRKPSAVVQKPKQPQTPAIADTAETVEKPPNAEMAEKKPTGFGSQLALPGKKIGESLPPIEPAQTEVKKVDEARTPFNELQPTEEQKDEETLLSLKNKLVKSEEAEARYHEIIAEKESTIDQEEEKYKKLLQEKSKNEKDLNNQIADQKKEKGLLKQNYESRLRDKDEACRKKVEQVEKERKNALGASDTQRHHLNERYAKLQHDTDNTINELRNTVDRLSHVQATLAVFESGEIQNLQNVPQWLIDLRQENEDLRAVCDEYAEGAKETDQLLDVAALDLGPAGTIRKIQEMNLGPNGITGGQPDSEPGQQTSQTPEEAKDYRAAMSLYDEVGEFSQDSSSSHGGDDDEEEDTEKTLTNIEDTMTPAQKGNQKAQIALFSDIVAELENKPEKATSPAPPKPAAASKPVAASKSAADSKPIAAAKPPADSKLATDSKPVAASKPAADSKPAAPSKHTLAIQALDPLLIKTVEGAELDYFESKPVDERAMRVERLLRDSENLKRRTEDRDNKARALSHERSAREQAEAELARTKTAKEELEKQERFRQKMIEAGRAQKEKEAVQKEGAQPANVQQGNVEQESAQQGGAQQKRGQTAEQGVQTDAGWATQHIKVGTEVFVPTLRDPTKRELWEQVSIFYFLPLILMVPLLIYFVMEGYYFRNLWLTSNDITLTHLLDIQAHGTDGSISSLLLSPLTSGLMWLENYLEMQTVLLG